MGWVGQVPLEHLRSLLGLVDLSDPAQAATRCAGCHVGAPAAGGLAARDMNHNMIAAGHPRLYFEYAAFLANLPRHWKEKSNAKDEAHRWAVGQVASAEVTLVSWPSGLAGAVTMRWETPLLAIDATS